ncbi:MAG TPA: sodium:glutamate symporter [Bosea sp. (in: a-proteobacteria)]|jgi:ESS family glutamate:Na+ symporter|uniref:sodium/glutamate symporter n=1 Tax=Bosea sp. (in: a-proteobacteria) TaxID=1871050 RepID=UPI002DDD36C4|nr:sodium:glutamate symporter [Bosea sp. (in: a-proteobacteria)]HEV2554282.1 sodium:glutamate symporter [Bosea sp. (in: a-proteobacteria)]
MMAWLPALAIMLLLLGAGVVLRLSSRVLARLFLPASLIGGLVGLLLGPQVLGAVVAAVGARDHWLTGGLLPGDALGVMAQLPGLAISVVFAALFLGERIPGPAEIWRIAGPQVAFGQTMAWGQYVVGLLLAILVLVPFFGLPPVSGALIEIGFEGGHGTAGGLSETFDAVGFPEGRDLALGLATVGVVSAVVIGVALINWAARRGIIDVAATPLPQTAAGAGHGARSLDEVVAPLSLALVFIALAIGLGWLMLKGLVLLELRIASPDSPPILRHMPLFPFAMIGGVIVQQAMAAMGREGLIERLMIRAIKGLALDLLILCAVATLSLTAIGTHLVPFMLLAVAGIAWSVACFWLLAPILMREWWFERAIADLGQSLGMTATGLMLLSMSDPGNRSPALASFGAKQLLFEPIVGGGLVTAAAMPLIAAFGPWPMLAVTSLILLFWVGLGLALFGKKNTETVDRRAQ